MDASEEKENNKKQIIESNDKMEEKKEMLNQPLAPIIISKKD